MLEVGFEFSMNNCTFSLLERSGGPKCGPKTSKNNYLCFGKPHLSRNDERKEERKRGTTYERKSLKRVKEEYRGTEKSEERKNGKVSRTEQARKSLTNLKEECKIRREQKAPQAKNKLSCICTKS